MQKNNNNNITVFKFIMTFLKVKIAKPKSDVRKNILFVYSMK